MHETSNKCRGRACFMHVQGLVHADLQTFLHVAAWLPRQRKALVPAHVHVLGTDHVYLDS